MDKAKTVFIVGAGASSEAGLPTGKQLTWKIANLLAINKQLAPESGGHTILSALRNYTSGTSNPRKILNGMIAAALQIRDAMPLASSIDAYIDSQQNEHISLCGKLAIASTILNAEKASLLCNRPAAGVPNFEHLDKGGSWYGNFFRLLCDRCTKQQLSERLRKVAFITFNYDRCIEQFLFYALRTYYGIDDGEAAEILKALTIFHPYGRVGHLPWERQEESVAFGAEPSPEKLLQVTTQIKTFTERVEEDTVREQMRALIQEADAIVVLGFAFHEQNIELIQSPKKSAAQRIFATAYELSASNCEVIKKRIAKLLNTDVAVHNLPLYLRSDLKCGSFLNEYSLSLRIP